MVFDMIAKDRDYLFLLNEKLKYMFSHLEEEENFSEEISTYFVRNDEEFSLIEANAGKIQWIVGNGTNESDFELTPGFIRVASETVDITGLVKFTDLSGESKTEINGSNITTGNLSADRISGGTIEGTTIRGTTINGATIESGTIESGSITANEVKGTTIKGGTIDIGETLYSDEDQTGLGEFTFTNYGAYQFFNDNFDCTEGVVNCYRVLSTYNMQTYSDRRLKENIKEIKNAGEYIDSLRPVTFRMKRTKEQGIGFIAQEINDPMLTGERNGYLTVKYASFLPILAAAIKESL